MPNRHRRIGAAVIGLALSTAAVASPNARRVQAVEIAKPVTVTITTDAAKDAEANRRQTDSSRRDSAALKAAERAATAAEDSATWAWWQLIVGILGAIGLGATLFLNWKVVSLAAKSSADANRSIDAALQSAAAMAAAAEAQHAANEAFVNLERARLVARVTKVIWNEGHISAVEVYIMNTGKSSAAILSAHCGFNERCTYPSAFEQTIALERTLEAPADTTFVIHATPPTLFNTHPYVGGYVEYRTTFGKTHHSYFLGKIEWMSEEETDFGFSHARYAISHNDPDCRREQRETQFGWPSDT